MATCHFCERQIKPAGILNYTPSPWPNKWLHPLKAPENDLKRDLEKISVYYPKNFRALKPISLSFYLNLAVSEDEYQRYELKELYRRSMTRYKKDFIRHVNVDLSCKDVPLDKLCKNPRSLTLFQSDYFIHKSKLAVKKIISKSKNLKVIDIQTKMPSAAETIKHLKYTHSLESLFINNLGYLTPKQYHKIFSMSSSLRSISITGYLENDYLQKTMNLVKFFRMLAALPTLKRINFDAKTSDFFDIDKIEFNLFQQKGIIFDIRVNQTGEEPLFSTTNESTLGSVDVLGISMQAQALENERGWDMFQHKRVEAQKKANNSLYVSLFEMRNPDLTNMFAACKNIRTLDLILTYSGNEVTDNVDFTGLRGLRNLENLFIELDSFFGIPASLFKNLNYCLQTYGALKSLSLHFSQCHILENGDLLLAFFEICSRTINGLTVKFTAQDDYQEGMQVIYQGISMLKNMKALSLIYEGFISEIFEPHKESLTNILSGKDTLEEFYISGPEVEIDFFRGKSLKKLSIHSNSYLLPGSYLLTKAFLQCHVTHIDLDIGFETEEALEQTFKIFMNLKSLEVLRLRYRIDFSEKNIISKLKELMKSCENLKYISFGSENDITKILVFTRSSLSTELESFYGRGFIGVPERKIEKVCSF